MSETNRELAERLAGPHDAICGPDSGLECAWDERVAAILAVLEEKDREKTRADEVHNNRMLAEGEQKLVLLARAESAEKERDEARARVAELDEHLKLAETSGDAIMTIRAELHERFGVEAAFFDDVIALALQKARAEGMAEGIEAVAKRIEEQVHHHPYYTAKELADRIARALLPQPEEEGKRK